MIGIVSFEDIKNIEPIARDFSRSLALPDNADIATEFPGTARRYSGDRENVHAELLKTQEQCQKGIREQFIIFAGQTAVGLSAIQLVDQPPEGIEQTVPNLSGLIFNPWRGKGFGSLSLKYRLDIINERFNGKAYSLVRKDNVISQKLVEASGLTIVGEDESKLTYLYNSKNR
jgi:RimJ/RimL family protein N-acetyltransferase